MPSGAGVTDRTLRAPPFDRDPDRHARSAHSHFRLAGISCRMPRSRTAARVQCTIRPIKSSHVRRGAHNGWPTNVTDGKALETLTRQQRNMALVEPIARLSLDRRVIFRDDPGIPDRLDVQFLALSAIDFVMERSAIESGALPDEIIEHIAREAAHIKPDLTERQGLKVGQTIVDHLGNAREGHKAFRIEYYDPGRGGFSFHDFRLLALSTAVDGSPRFKLAAGAQTLALAMLDVGPEFAQEAEAIMLQKAVERGRFEDALTLARRSRIRSIHYKQYIEDQLFHARRAADRLTWSEAVLPQLDQARAHLADRRKHETIIIESIREHLAEAQGDARDRLVVLKNTIDDSHERHAALFQRVMSASEEFRRIQADAFRTRLVRDIPDIEERILGPLLAAPIRTAADMGDDIAIVFAAPSPPHLYDLALLFETATQPRAQRDPAGTEDIYDLVTLERVPPEFDGDDIRTAQDWLARTIEARMRLDMASAIREAENQDLAESTLRCILFLMLRSWCPVDDPLGVIASIDGAIAHDRVAGDNLVLERDDQRWPI